jgi:hypothetical protein
VSAVLLIVREADLMVGVEHVASTRILVLGILDILNYPRLFIIRCL